MNNIMWLWLMVLNILKLHSCIVMPLPCRTTLNPIFLVPLTLQLRMYHDIFSSVTSYRCQARETQKATPFRQWALVLVGMHAGSVA